MKKTTLLTFLMVLPFMVNAQTFNFDTDGDTEGWSQANSTIDVSGGIFTLTPEDATRYPAAKYAGGLVAVDGQYLHITMRNTNPLITRIRFKVDADGTYTNTTISNFTDYVTYNIDISGNSGWTGNVADITIRFEATSGIIASEGHLIEIDQIIFDNNPSVGPPSPQTRFDFDTDEEGWIGKNGTINASGGILTHTPDGTNANSNIQYLNGIDATVNGYMHISVKNNSTTSNEMRFVIKKASDPSKSSYKNTAISNSDTSFNNYDVQLAGLDGWDTASEDNITIRFTDRSTIQTAVETVEIDYVIFDNDAVLKVESLEKFNFSYYPNPTQDYINLNAAEPIKQVIVYNIMGQEVKRVNFKDKSNPAINVSNLQTGIYNMKVEIGNATGVFKFIKK